MLPDFRLSCNMAGGGRGLLIAWGFQILYTGTLKDRKIGTGAPHPKSPMCNEPPPVLKMKTSNFVGWLTECPLDPWKYNQMSSNTINVFFPEQMAKLGCPLCRYLNLIYVINTPRPEILGLPSCSRLRIVHLNCSVQFRKYGQLVTVSKEQDMKNLNLINSKDDLITAYPDQLKELGNSQVPTTYISERMPYLLCTHLGNSQ